jgi:hypothetical protein
MPALEASFASFRVAVVAERGAAVPDRGREDALQRAVERASLRVRDLRGERARMDSRRPQRLVDVDVPETGEPALV